MVLVPETFLTSLLSATLSRLFWGLSYHRGTLALFQLSA